MNKIKILLIAMLISALCGGFAIRSFFPKKVEVEIKVKPTVHELKLLAEQISKGTIDSLQKVIDSKPKIIYKDRMVKGKVIRDSFPVFPVGFRDILNEKKWEKEFINENRDNDSLSLTTKDSVRVTSYVDTLDNSYIGYETFHSWIEDIKLVVSPEIEEVEYINRFSLFINGGFIIDEKEIISNNIISTKYSAGLTIDLGIVLDEQWIITPSITMASDHTSYGLKFGTYLLRIGKCKRSINP